MSGGAIFNWLQLVSNVVDAVDNVIAGDDGEGQPLPPVKVLPSSRRHYAGFFMPHNVGL